ncbi:MAG: hypothetical protein ACK57J_06680 [Rubrivivax sp.]
MSRLWRLTALVCAAVVMAITVLAYFSPPLAADLANRFWACF